MNETVLHFSRRATLHNNTVERGQIEDEGTGQKFELSEDSIQL